MARGLMSDAEWAFFETFIREVRAPQGRPAGDHRRVLDGVFWIARTGSAWRDLPEEFGKWSSVYRQFRRWTLVGLWEAILEALSEGAAKIEHAPDRLQMVDSTIVRAHQHAAGALKKGAGALKKGAGALRARVLAVLEVASRPRSTSGSTPGVCRCAPTSRPARPPITAASTS